MPYVNSVTVYPSSATVTKGKWYYGAYASIASDCPGCAEVRWYSNNSSIASVNKSTGYIYGVNTGTTRIYAEATDGSGKKDYITVTVTAPVSVTGVSICPTSKTMNVGDTDYLCETVYPQDATNQTVTWCSSDESVAEVNTYTGFVRAKKAGIVTITACTVDGGFAACCTVFVSIPELFEDFINRGTINSFDIKCTDDGFSLLTVSLADILTRNNIYFLFNSLDGEEATPVTGYYDDWYLFAVENSSSVKYGLCKMREQENDYVQGQTDLDDPGVTISFISINKGLIKNCLTSATQLNTFNLLQGLNKVTGPGVYEHDEQITSYFAKTSSKGAYLIAEEYVRFISEKSINGVLSVPNLFISMLEEIESIDTQLENIWLDNTSRLALINKKNGLMRIPNWLTQNNEKAGYNVYNSTNRTIEINNTDNLSIYEKYAILATFTADVNFNSFVAEVQFHADAVDNWKSDLPIVGDDWYESAVRADMAIGEDYESGFYDEYYDLNSDIVKAQAKYHGEY